MSKLNRIFEELGKHKWQLAIRSSVVGKCIIDISDKHDGLVRYEVYDTLEDGIEQLYQKLVN